MRISTEKLATYLTSLMIAFAGIGFLIFTVWYIINFPIPDPMQPLRHRIITILRLEEVAIKDSFIELKDNKDIIVYTEPNEDSEKITAISLGEHKILKNIDNWFKIELNEDVSGWIKN